MEIEDEFDGGIRDVVSHTRGLLTLSDNHADLFPTGYQILPTLYRRDRDERVAPTCPGVYRHTTPNGG